MSHSFFIARRLYYGGDDAKRRVSKPAIRIATAGVAIGLMVMIVTVCVVLGFKASVKNKVSGLAGDVQIRNFTALQYGVNEPMASNDSLMTAVRRTSGVRHVQRYSTVQGVLKTDADFMGIVFEGVGEDYDTTFIASNLVEGSMTAFSDSSASNRIVISKIMADALRLKCGERVFAYFISDNGVRARRFTICGIYRTNMSHYDKMLAFTDAYTARRLNGWTSEQCTGLEVMAKDNSDEGREECAEALRNTLRGTNCSVRSLADVYPGIFAWLGLLDLNLWIILALMVCVSGFTMISGLLIIILERTQMIGLFKSLGYNNGGIRRIFIWFAAFIIGRGVLIGDVLGLGFCLLQRYTHFVRLDAENYYIDNVPVVIDWSLMIALNLAVILIIVLIEIIPSQIISRISPAKSMRYE